MSSPPERAAAFAPAVHAVPWVSSTAAELPWLLRARPTTGLATGKTVPDA